MVTYGDNSITTYYISNTGNVNNDGLSPATAKTLAGFSSLDLSKRCAVLFKAGETYNTSFVITNRNVRFDSYGTGSKPIFYGSTDISGLTWTNEGDGTFSAVVSEPDWIYINGVCAKLSETPWITVTAYPAINKFGINNTDVAAYGNIVGSRLTWLARPWTTEYLYSVTAYASSVITINTATTTQTSVGGTTIKLLGKKAYMVANNEWAYEGGKLYIKSTVSPATMNIRSSNQRIGISISNGAHGFDCMNLEFRDFYYAAIQRNQAENLIVDSCTFSNMNGYAISTIGTSNFATFSNNTITNSNGGIYDVATRISTITNNLIHDIGMMGNIGSMPDYNMVIAANKAIYMRDLNTTGFLHFKSEIFNNRVYNVASTGIHFQGNVTCHQNIVHDFMKLFSDGGGIYCYASANYTNIGSEVYKNIVYAGGPDACSGIYVDNRCISFDIHDNVIYGMSMAGINMNWDKQFTSCRNNIIVDCLYCMRYTTGGTWTAYAVNEGNISTGNIMACRSNIQFCHRAEVTDATVNYNPFNNGGSSNNNYYISPYIGRVAWHQDDISMTFSELKTRYSSDAASVTKNLYKTYVDQAQALIDVLLITNETDTAIVQSIGAGYTDVASNVITQVTVPAYGGFVALKS